MNSEINQLPLIITEIEKSTGEVIQLIPNSKQSIQPKSLLRLGVFVPTLKDGSDPMSRGHHIDATKELCRLSSLSGEGYEKISIFGPRLDMDTDFKVWLGIVDSLTNKYLEKDGTVRMYFIDFACSCGLATKRVDSRLRKRFSDSLTRIQHTHFQFIKPSSVEGKKIKIDMSLVSTSYYDEGTDEVIIRPNPDLNTLYQVDGKTRLYLKILKTLARKESAQALYLYLVELPDNFYRIGFDRLRERLQLTAHKGSQNATIRRALEQLEEAGFLKYSIEKSRGDYVLVILNRNKKIA
ncbi:replication initiation protein [Klebsiella oxytoca]|uniref:RepB family plasmid replication initiator protein n=1 Tax=Klebsiella oxytoca TaxID=571 RepID=UPI001CCD6EA1|nr:RepB family plasmid replication initiator protein [Klebsiella oxytoca]MBZ7324019.1 replication initiation protein [Klebsiella oxytoca]